MIAAVCFDLDGTLIDSNEAIVASFYHAFDVLGLPRPDREAIVGSIGYLLEDQIAKLTDRDPHEVARIYREYYGRVCCELTRLMPGGREVLDALHAAGLPLGFATSKRRYYAEIILRHLGVLDYFDARVGAEDVTHAKPHPEALHKVAELLEVAPENMVLVGDTHFDVLAARNGGVRCVCVTLGYGDRKTLEALQPDALFDSLAEACAYILKNREQDIGGSGAQRSVAS